MLHNRTTALSLLLLLSPFCASAAQFILPLHLPPHLPGLEKGEPAKFRLGLGYAGASADGILVSGPGGYWELAAPGPGKLAYSVRGSGFLLSGKVDSFSIGHKSGGGLAGALEGSIIAAPWGKDAARLYTGLIFGITILGVRDPAIFQLLDGRSRAEPSSAFSLQLGLPFGALFPVALGGSWKGEAQADLTIFPAGVTFFSYGLAGPTAYGSTRKTGMQFSLGCRAGAVYAPWGLRLEALGRFSPRGNDRGTFSWWAFQAALKLF